MKQYILLVLILVVLFLNIPTKSSPVSNNVDYDLYGYDACPYTLKMKHELETKHIKFTYKQIDKNENFRQEYESYGVKGVPFVVNKSTGEHFVGFRSM